jgi:uncharacterized protein with HEPN domain
MKKDPLIFLNHILESIEAIEKYMVNISAKEFLEDEEKQDAVIRRLEIIGEAVKNIPEEYKEDHAEIAWSKAMGTRNILIHHYFGVDLDIVWYTVTNSLPEFKKQISDLINHK